MYLHIGQDVLVSMKAVVGVFDMDTATRSKHTRKMIARLEKKGRVVPLFDDLPKSCVLTQENGLETLYISQISTTTLLKRSESRGILRRW